MSNTNCKILTTTFTLLNYCITNVKFSDWLMEKMYSYKKVHLDMTSKMVLSDVRGNVAIITVD